MTSARRGGPVSAESVARAAEARGIAPAVAAGCAAWRPTLSPAGAWVREVGGSSLYFDLASVTKPMLAVTVARTGIPRTTPLGALLVEARGTASEGVSLELLLAHRAGLVNHLPLHAPVVRGEGVDPSAALREAANARRSGAAGNVPDDGFPSLYSDLGYALAGEAIARATGLRDAGDAILRWVLEPLGIASHAGTVRDLAARGIRGPFAPTEDVAWRGGVVSGAVHDETAWVLTGFGGSGHAGIFATIDAVVTFGAAVIDACEGRGIFGAADVAWLMRARPDGTLRAGFDGKSEEASSAGSRMGRTSVGHLGFTGTSLWLDLEARIVVALLTNRVHPSREHRAIREERPGAHDSLFDRAVLLRDRG